MTAIDRDGPGGRPGESDLSRTYTMVIIVEILVLAGLYWLTRHFA